MIQPQAAAGRSQRYREMLEFIRRDVQGERRVLSRRMFNVFLWCFLLPAVVSMLLLVLIKAGVVPRSFGGYVEWLVLIFPILYAVYVIASEMVSGMPSIFRWGGIANTLKQSVQDAEWRDRVCAELRTKIGGDRQAWEWIVASLRMDLDAIHHRAKYLTALAGAVFYLLMQGLDSVGTEQENLHQTLQGWFEASMNNLAQFVGLGLFLVLLYLSANQAFVSLSRYLRCAELVLLELRDRE
ncbi:MAG: hypothetical protein NDJ90_09040 [Oligoflexia bacterium]|nr:hypothetical protein [Oligoflexia bacterium]